MRSIELSRLRNSTMCEIQHTMCLTQRLSIRAIFLQQHNTGTSGGASTLRADLTLDEMVLRTRDEIQLNTPVAGPSEVTGVEGPSSTKEASLAS